MKDTMKNKIFITWIRNEFNLGHKQAINVIGKCVQKVLFTSTIDEIVNPLFFRWRF